MTITITTIPSLNLALNILIYYESTSKDDYYSLLFFLFYYYSSNFLLLQCSNPNPSCLTLAAYACFCLITSCLHHDMDMINMIMRYVDK